MNDGCPNCDALCTICQDNTWNWHQPLCSSCRLAVAHTEARIIKLLEERSDVIQEFTYAIALIKGEK